MTLERVFSIGFMAWVLVLTLTVLSAAGRLP